MFWTIFLELLIIQIIETPIDPWPHKRGYETIESMISLIKDLLKKKAIMAVILSRYDAANLQKFRGSLSQRGEGFTYQQI
jgi:hypothetical protein